MVIGGIFEKQANGKYKTDKDGDYILNQKATEEMIKKNFPDPSEEELKRLRSVEEKLREQLKDMEKS